MPVLVVERPAATLRLAAVVDQDAEAFPHHHVEAVHPEVGLRASPVTELLTRDQEMTAGAAVWMDRQRERRPQRREPRVKCPLAGLHDVQLSRVCPRREL